MQQKKAKQLLEIRHVEVVWASSQVNGKVGRGKRGEWLEAQTSKELAQRSRRRYEESLGHGAMAQAGAQRRQPERKP